MIRLNYLVWSGPFVLAINYTIKYMNRLLQATMCSHKIADQSLTWSKNRVCSSNIDTFTQSDRRFFIPDFIVTLIVQLAIHAFTLIQNIQRLIKSSTWSDKVFSFTGMGHNTGMDYWMDLNTCMWFWVLFMYFIRTEWSRLPQKVISLRNMQFRYHSMDSIRLVGTRIIYCLGYCCSGTTLNPAFYW